MTIYHTVQNEMRKRRRLISFYEIPSDPLTPEHHRADARTPTAVWLFLLPRPLHSLLRGCWKFLPTIYTLQSYQMIQSPATTNGPTALHPRCNPAPFATTLCVF